MMSDIKSSLYIVNSILVSLAILLIAMGIYCNKIPGPPFIGLGPSVTLGVFVCLVTAYGLAALRMNQIALMIIYLAVLICIFGAQVVFGVASLAMESQVLVKSFLKNSYVMRSKNEHDSNIQNFQEFYQCCGFDGPDGDDVTVQDKIYLSKGDEKPVLHNAIHLISECCPGLPPVCTKLDAYRDDCASKMIENHKGWEKIFGILLLVSGLVLLFSATLAVQEMTRVT